MSFEYDQNIAVDYNSKVYRHGLKQNHQQVLSADSCSTLVFQASDLHQNSLDFP